MTADRFGEFLGCLSSALDEHEARADDLAARMYFSRSHFDRVVAASSGETPGRFRRRVLLERSAYQLATSDIGVLDIAIEAGYSSHEAFTRAFQRAYGRTPSAWRVEPTRIQLETPNGVHFHPPGGLMLPARTKVTSMDLLTRMIEHHIWLIGQMIDRAATLDDTELDRRIEISVEGIDDDPTMRSLLSRLIGQMDMWNQVIAQRVYDFSIETHESIDSMRHRLARVGPVFHGHVSTAVSEGRLDETFIDCGPDQASPPELYSYGGLIAHVLTFAAVRRTLVVGALASAGIDDLTYGDPRLWVNN